MDLNNIFVTVGTTRFDLLISTITQPNCIQALKRLGCKRIVLQVGNGELMPTFECDGIKLSAYRYTNSILEDMSKADLIISHAGAGSCLEALELEKPLLVVVNTDLMNNHQIELATKLKDCGYLYYTTCDKLYETLVHLDFRSLRPYPKSDPRIFSNAIDRIMGFI